MRLRSARNTFVHKGISDVDVASTVSLIDAANTIIAWIEQYLPPEQRRPYQVPKVTTELTKLFIAGPVDVVDMRDRPQGRPPA